jgi:dihydrofolate synthase/folylpolyglutamate synthase
MPPTADPRRIETAAQAGAWLSGLVNLEMQPDLPSSRIDLAAIRALMRRLGNPERGLPVIHIGGSKGKGSTALFVESILRNAGHRVGTFTSPHLECWTERFRLDGADVSGPRLAAAVDRLRPHVEALREEMPDRAPSFFDATTAAALLLFVEARVDFAVLEVGLGGRLDSTNICEPLLTCITSIELEHTDRLGTTLAEIAREKAGILKPGVPAVLGRLPDPARTAIRARAREVGAPCVELGRDFNSVLEDEGSRRPLLRVEDGPLRVEAHLNAPGQHQADNAALAVACVRRTLRAATDLAGACARGLSDARLPGRVEVLGRRPTLVVDAAHTAASARALANALGSLPRRRTRLVLSISAGKDADAILAATLPLADEVTVTRAEATRSLDPQSVAEAVRRAAPNLPLRVVPNPHLAVRAARDGLGEDDLLLVTGSIYLAGIARRVLRETDGSRRVSVSRRSDRGPVAEP